MCLMNPLCRHGTHHPEPIKTYATVLVEDMWASVLECETQFVPSFSTWCIYCERMSFIPSNTFDDCKPVGALVVHGPLTHQEARVRESSLEAQVVLWRQLRVLDLSPFVPMQQDM
jgi:hypothetical protein